MARATPRPDNVFNLFDDDLVADEVSVGHRVLSATQAPPPAGQVLDLTGKPKLLMAFGSGGSGKSTLLRWVAERSIATGSTAKLVAIDPGERSLMNYFPPGAVYEPVTADNVPTHDAAQVATWLKAFFGALVKQQVSGLIDTGGGDTAVEKVLQDMPRLVDDLAAEGIATVAVYMFAPRTDDVGPLATLTGAGFSPAATALVINEGAVRPSDGDPALAFREIKRHSVYRAALDRGAVELHMPVLSIAKKISDRSLQFGQARDGVAPEGKKVVPLGWSDRAVLRSWLTRMDDAFAPIVSWWP